MRLHWNYSVDSKVTGAIVDVDGVVLRQGDLIPSVPAALSMLQEIGVKIVFITNNVSTPRTRITSLLKEASGLSGPLLVDPLSVLEEAIAAGVAVVGPWLILGSEDMTKRLSRMGIIASDEPHDEVSGLIVGSVVHLEYAQLLHAARCLSLGVPGWATGLDRLFHWRQLLWPGVGAIVSFLEYTTSRPLKVLGKPNAKMLELAYKMIGGGRVLAIGDDLTMDIQPANEMGLDTALVLTGVTDEATLRSSSIRPTLVFDDLYTLAASLAEGGLLQRV